MMKNVLIRPFFYAHIFNGILLFLAGFMLFVSYSKIQKMDSYKLILLTLCFSIAIGVHGLSHLGLESIYGYNPLVKLY